ncbi:MAG: hypothetical protein IT562_19545 [Alphaproteobacteria bacterium]|nr:hypothetical protein [Alphaproteobacteria bacterium]
MAALLLAALAVVATLALCEAAARQFFDPSNYYIRTPGWEIVFNPTPEGTPGIAVPAHILINRYGLRGDVLRRLSFFRRGGRGGRRHRPARRRALGSAVTAPGPKKRRAAPVRGGPRFCLGSSEGGQLTCACR